MKTLLACLAVLVLVTGCNTPAGDNGGSSFTAAPSSDTTTLNGPVGAGGPGVGAGGTGLGVGSSAAGTGGGRP